MFNTKSAKFESASSQYLSIAHEDQSGLDFSNDFSVSFWFKFTTGDDCYIRFFDKFDSLFGWHIYYNYTGGHHTFYLRVGNGSGSAGHSVYPASITNGEWAHIQLSWDQSARRLYGWKNGVAMSTDPDRGGGEYLVGGSVDLNIGYYDGATPVNIFNGLMDEVCIWNDFRTSGEAAAEYNSGDGVYYNGDEAGLKAYWRMEDDFLDTTANDNDLTNHSCAFSDDVPFGAPPSADFIPKIYILLLILTLIL